MFYTNLYHRIKGYVDVITNAYSMTIERQSPPPPVIPNKLLTEDGFDLLLEDGDKILLE